MKIEVFDKTAFSKQSDIIYTPKGWQRHILVGVNFEERLLEIRKESGQGSLDPFWVRCESVELV